MKLTDWVGGICFIIALLILWQFRVILLLVFASVVLAIALNGLVRTLVRKFHVQRSTAVLISIILVLLGGAIFIGLVMPPFIGQFQQLILLLPAAAREVINGLDAWINNPPTWFPQPEVDLLPQLTDLIQQVGPLASQLFGNFFTWFSNALGVLLQLLLVVVLTIMMLSDPDAYRQLVLRLFPSFYRRRADEIFARCEVTLLSWMAGISINSLFVATMSAIGLLVMGVPFVFAHALLAGVANFIPNIGPTLSVVFPVSVALLESPGKAIAVVILYLIIQNIESYWLSPMVMQKQVSLLPAVTLVAQIFFATFLGILGLVLALPLAVVAKIWIEEAFIKDVLDTWREDASETPEAPSVMILETTTGPEVPPEAFLPETYPSD